MSRTRFSDASRIVARALRAMYVARSACMLVLVIMGLGAFAVPATAAAALAGTVIVNKAYVEYVPSGYTQIEHVDSNPVQATVQVVESLVLTRDQSVNRPPAVVSTLGHLLFNSGNVSSTYTFTLTSNGARCPATATAALGSLRLVRDINANGVIDAGDSPLVLGAAGALRLAPGASVDLLVEGVTPLLSAASACVVLNVTTDAQHVSANNIDVISISNAAVITLRKSASFSGIMIPGTTTVDFQINASNIGVQGAVAAAVADGVPIMVNGAARTLLLVRDVIPAGLQYVPGSLQSQALGALRLFRLPSDPLFNYRTGADDASAIEVAIGVPTGLVRDGSLAMTLSTKLLTDASDYVVNDAQGYYNDGSAIAKATSNPVVVPVTPARVGLAKAAHVAVPQVNASGAPDGTIKVNFSLRTRNYGATTLYDVQVVDALEGAGASQFGSYTAQPNPGAGQYTVVPGSVRITANSGATVVANTSYTGQAAQSSLLAAGARLPVGSEFTTGFELRINTTGRAGTLLNSARVSAALSAGAKPVIGALSANGTDPDANRNGDPTDDSKATPISIDVPVLTLQKLVAGQRHIASGVYEMDYVLRVTNAGKSPAANIRLIDNLNCALDMDRDIGHIASWSLVGGVKSVHGVLAPAATFTGIAPCDRASESSTTPFTVPTAQSLRLTDGVSVLAPGQTDDLTFTVRVQIKPAYIGTGTRVTNRAWAAAYQANTLAPSALVSSSSSTTEALLIDPQGVVYDVVSRLPVPGSIVTLKRTSCSTSTAGPITAAELFVPGEGAHTFNADGTVSFTVGANGEYQFYFRSPPVVDVCDYNITVVPPVGSGYVAPSTIVPAQPGTFTTCGAVVSQAGAPQGTADTRYFNNLRTGINVGSGAICEVIHNHIPLDPNARDGLLLKKVGSKKAAEFGDFVDYAITLTNQTGISLIGVSFADVLPAGFAYVKGTVRLNGLAVAEPAGGAGPNLTFAYPTFKLAAGASATVRYRLRIGVGSPTTGDAINRARATSGPLQSNEASWRVTLSGGVFSGEAFAFGKVYVGCPRTDGGLDPDQRQGVPGVRLFMENGTSVTTDVDGKWSLYGLKPITHVIKVDATTLPAGARLAVLDNRNAGSPDSRFLDVKNGEFMRADFLIAECDPSTAMLNQIEARRAAALVIARAANDSPVNVRLATDGRVQQSGDLRGLAATGQIATNGGATIGALPSGPLIGLPASAGVPLQAVGPMASGAPVVPLLAPLVVGGSDLLGPLPAPDSIDLETLLPFEDDTPGFIGLKNGDTVLSQTVNIRVKGPFGSNFRLAVDGQDIPERSVGKKAVLRSKNVVAWEFIGIVLKPGENRLTLKVVDDFGNTRTEQGVMVIAPDQLGRIEFDLPANARADLRTPVSIKLRLVDAKGVPVTSRTAVTLETDRGRWLDKDLNPNEQGTQIFVEGGTADLTYIPPGEPGTVRVRASSGTIVSESRLVLLPEQRAMSGIGIVEGVLDFSRGAALSLGTPSAANAFESQLGGLTTQIGSTDVAARSAFYFKGTVKGDYLLTTAFDSDKTTRDRLFRDIRPDELYPVYGDTSVKGFDAQSTQKLYVRIDKNRSFLLYGDFTTASSPEARQLSQVSRSLTGIKNQYESEGVRVSSFASYDNLKQKIEEIPALGISGPYFLAGTSSGDRLANSEKVEILVRDRNQRNIVLKATAMSRFTDYNIEPLTGRLLFLAPIASLDANFNPQSIRLTYEVSDGGAKFLVAGTDVQVKVGERLQLGAVVAIDQNPDNQRKLVATTALARLGENTVLNAEAVNTTSDLKGSGNAQRVELRHDDKALKAQAQFLHTSENFDNPSASATGGRTELTGRADYTLDPTLRLKGEMLYSKEAVSVSTRTGMSVALQKRLGDILTGELGLRHGNQNGTAAGSFDYGQVGSATAGAASGTGSGGSLGSASVSTTTARVRLTSRIPMLPQAQVFGEVEQDVNHADRHAVALGGTYALTEKTRAYGRYELLSSLTSQYNLNSTQQRNVALFGIESAYMEGGRIYNEYRMADVIDSRSTQSAFGVRNMFKATENLSLTAGFEQTRMLGQTSAASSTSGLPSAITGPTDAIAIVTGADYVNDSLRLSGTLEARKASAANTLLNSLGASYRLDTAWTMLARSTINSTIGSDKQAALLQARQQIGMAYRPADGNDFWNALGRYEHKYEQIGSAGAVAADGALLADARLPGTTRTHIVAGVVNFAPERGTAITARYAAKISQAGDDIAKSSYWAQLAHVRYTKDLTPEWDVGVQGGLLYGKGGALQSTLGMEVGYQLMRNLWISGGYNILGLKDPDLTGADHTSRGAYLRLRFKFDENSLGMGAPASAANPAATVRAGRVGDSAVTPAVVRSGSAPAWKSGSVFPARVTLSEWQLFEPTQATLSPAGITLLAQLGEQLAAQGSGGVEVVAHDPAPTVAASNELWLGRAAAVRTALQAHGPRMVTISTDSQPLAALPRIAQNQLGAATPAGRSLQIALVANQ